MIDIDQYLEEKRNIVNLALKKRLPQSGPPKILDAMNYSLEAGGKRLRPILTLAVADTLGYKSNAILDPACALEFVHTYSLIHDDLPAMDNSDLRRGKPTCHRVYGDAVAVLAGDALLTHAFEILSRYGQKEGYAEKSVKIIAELSSASGVTGMIGGQILDLESEGKALTFDQVERLSVMKTGALLRAAVVCGAIASDASSEQLKILGSYAGDIGTAFQITDDLLDLEGSREELGKPVGADQERYKPTYPSVLGPENARKKAVMLYEQAVISISTLDQPAELLIELAKKLIFRNK